MANINLSWDQELDTSSISRAITEAVQDQILSDPQFRQAVADALRETPQPLISAAIAEALQHDLIAFLRGKIQPLKDELNSMLRDYEYFITAHSSDYAHRRKEELLKKLADLQSV